MSDPVTAPSNSRTTVSTAEVPRTPADAENASMTARALQNAVLAPQVGDLYTTLPGFRFTLGGGAQSSQSVGNYLGLAKGLTPQTYLNNPMLQTNPQAQGYVNLALSFTPAGFGDGSDKVVPTFSLALDGAAGVKTSGVAQTTTSAAKVLQQGSAIAAQANDLQQQISQKLDHMQSLMNQLNKAVMNNRWNTVAQLQPQLLKALSDIEAWTGIAQGVLDSASSFSGWLSRQNEGLGLKVSARGALTADLTLRRELGHVNFGKSGVRVLAAVSGGLVTPLPAPDQSAQFGVEAIRSTMVTVDAVVHVQGRGFDELSKTMAQLSSLLGTINSQAKSAQAQPNPSDAAHVKQMIDTAQGLNSSAQNLSNELTTTLTTLGANVQLGARLTQATGPGAELKEVGLKIEGHVGETEGHAGGQFTSDVAVTLRHLLGYIPGTSSIYGLASDGSLAGQLMSRQTGNVYPIFFPATVALDASLAYHPRKEISLSLRAGAEERFDRSSTTAYAGLVTQFYFIRTGVGLIAPDIKHMDIFRPQPALSVGFGSNHFDLNIAVSAGSTGAAGSAASTSPFNLTAGQGLFLMTIK